MVLESLAHPKLKRRLSTQATLKGLQRVLAACQQQRASQGLVGLGVGTLMSLKLLFLIGGPALLLGLARAEGSASK
jgi:hypothetical protein